MKRLMSVVLVALMVTVLCSCAPSGDVVDTSAIRDKAYQDGYDAGYDEGYAAALAEATEPTTPTETGNPDSPTEPDASSDDILVGMRKRPAKMNETVSLSLNTTYTSNASGWLDLTMIDFVRGDDAWKMIEETNQFNSEAPEGKEYILVKFRATYVADENNTDDSAFNINNMQFTVASPEYATITTMGGTTTMLVLPDPSLNSDLYDGASTEGWVAFEVDEGSTGFYALYKDFAWFSLSGE